MKSTSGSAIMTGDSHREEFIRNMNSDGIPARMFQEDNWKRWIQDQFERVLSIRGKTN